MDSITQLAPLKTEHASIISDWLQGVDGRETLRLLGNVIPDDFTTDEATELKRIEEIIADGNRHAWIIIFDGKPVGVAEANFLATNEIEAPHISFFIGDKNNRGNGIGSAALNLIIDDLNSKSFDIIFGRALTINSASQKVLEKTGFIKYGAVYADNDGLSWQNYKVV